MIDSIETLFLYLGITLFVLGFISLFVKKMWRLGIITLIVSDFPFAISVAYVKKAILYMPFYTLSESVSRFIGIALGLLIFFLLLVLYRKTLMKLAYREKDIKNEEIEKTKDDTKEA